MDSQHPHCLGLQSQEIFMPSILIYLLVLSLFSSFKAAILLEDHIYFPVKTRRYNFIADFLVLSCLKDFLHFHDFPWALVEGVVLEVYYLSLLQWSCKNNGFKSPGQLTRFSVPSVISFLSSGPNVHLETWCLLPRYECYFFNLRDILSW